MLMKNEGDEMAATDGEEGKYLVKLVIEQAARFAIL